MIVGQQLPKLHLYTRACDISHTAPEALSKFERFPPQMVQALMINAEKPYFQQSYVLDLIIAARKSGLQFHFKILLL